MFTVSKRIRLFGLVLAAALLGLLAVSSPTLASTARLNKLGVEYIADAGEANDVTITASNAAGGETFGGGPIAIDIADTGPGVTITPEWPWPHWWGCEENSLRPGVALCWLEEPTSLIFVDLGDQDDRFSMVFNHPVAAQGGDGDDNMSGGPAADDLRGEGGSDTLFGGAGNDFLAGFAGNDTLVGGPGGDGLVGGTGQDFADYSARTAPLRVTIGDAAGDGEAGEGDIVAVDVESVRGGSGDDTLVAGAAASKLTGGPGYDNLIGGVGDDRIDAQDGGPDVIDCGGGHDVVYADFGTQAWIGPPPPPGDPLMLIPDITSNCEVIMYGN